MRKHSPRRTVIIYLSLVAFSRHVRVILRNKERLFKVRRTEQRKVTASRHVCVWPLKGPFLFKGCAVWSLLLLCLLRQQDSLDVGQDAALGNGDSRKKLVQLLVVSDGQLKMTRDDPSLLVVTSGVTGQLKYFGG